MRGNDTLLRQRRQRSLGPNDSREPVGKRQGLTRLQVAAEVQRQNGLCALCPRPLGDTFVVDHDHALAVVHGHAVETGCPACYRALLCRRCNSVIGWGGEDAEYFLRVAKFIGIRRPR